jgi:His/Glu/Gln/Arg/opine family amino acid ABC transporter permease subunit
MQPAEAGRRADVLALIRPGLVVVLVAAGVLILGGLLSQGTPVGLDWGILWINRFLLVQGAATTVALAVLAAAFGTLIGLLAALARVAGVRFLAQYAQGYTEIFRGSPLLLQLFWIWFGLPLIGVPINGFAAAVIGLSLNAGAFCAEIFRGGILAVPRGQSEAALASGMTYLQTMRYVVLPQIVRSSLPPLMGQQISLVKDTSLASLISFQELMLMTQSIIDRTHRIFELYIGAAAVYFVICYPLSQLVRTVEKRLARQS